MSRTRWAIIISLVVFAALGKGYHSMWLSQMEEIGRSPVISKEVVKDIQKNYEKCVGMPTKKQDKIISSGFIGATTFSYGPAEQEEVCDENYGQED